MNYVIVALAAFILVVLLRITTVSVGNLRTKASIELEKRISACIQARLSILDQCCIESQQYDLRANIDKLFITSVSSMRKLMHIDNEITRIEMSLKKLNALPNWALASLSVLDEELLRHYSKYNKKFIISKTKFYRSENIIN